MDLALKKCSNLGCFLAELVQPSCYQINSVLFMDSLYVCSPILIQIPINKTHAQRKRNGVMMWLKFHMRMPSYNISCDKLIKQLLKHISSKQICLYHGKPVTCFSWETSYVIAFVCNKIYWVALICLASSCLNKLHMFCILSCIYSNVYLSYSMHF